MACLLIWPETLSGYFIVLSLLWGVYVDKALVLDRGDIGMFHFTSSHPQYFPFPLPPPSPISSSSLIPPLSLLLFAYFLQLPPLSITLTLMPPDENDTKTTLRSRSRALTK